MIGDFVAGATVRTKFNTKSGGVPITLVGGAVSVYKDGSTTQSTAGVTLTADFDGVTGYHSIDIDTSADGTFYSAGSDFEIVLTAGTVDGVSQAGTVLDKFSISNRVAPIRADVERSGGMLQVTQGHASTASSEASLAKTNAAAAPAATIAGLNTTAVPGSPTAGTYAERFLRIQNTGQVATAAEVAGNADTRDLAEVSHKWQLTRSGSGAFRSTEASTLYLPVGTADYRVGWVCDIPQILPAGVIITSQTTPELVDASADVTVTATGHDAKMPKGSIDIDANATVGSEHWVKTTIVGSNGTGPIAVYGKIVITAEP